MAPPDSGAYAAYPELAADTLGFVPYPIQAVYASSPGAYPATHMQAVDRNRRVLRDLTRRWVAGAPRDGRTSVVALAETTRRDNLATFPEFASVDEVPTHGVSVGLATIAGARALRLVLHGPDKREAAARLLSLDAFDPSWPASIVHDHPDARIYVDREALGE